MSRVAMPMAKPLRGLRVHRAAAAAGSAADGRAAWLLRLRGATERAEQRHAELTACLEALRAGAAALPDQVRQNLQQVAAVATEIGLEVARGVVGDAVERGLVDPTPTVRRCLEQATVGLTGTEVEVRLHPEDLSLVMAELDRDPALRGLIEGARFTPDAGLARAAVTVRTDTGKLVYDHHEVLARIADEVRKSAVAGGDGGAP